MLKRCVNQAVPVRGLRTLSGVRRQQLRKDSAPRSLAGSNNDGLKSERSIHPHTRPQAHEDVKRPSDTAPIDSQSTLQYLYKSDYDAKLIEKVLESAKTATELDEDFWSAVSRVARDRHAHEGRHIDLFVLLFEAAKNEPNPLLRQEYVCVVGRYIYGARRVRLDPINEVVFLDSLVASGRSIQALRLWSSRKGRDDVKDSTYWPEVGVLYHLDAGLSSAAHRLAQSRKYIPPRVVLALIQEFARRPVAANFEKLSWWVEYIISQPLVEKVRFRKKMAVPEKMQLELKVNIGDLQAVLRTLVRYQQWNLANLVAQKIGEKLDGRRIVEDICKSAAPKVFHRKEARFVPGSIGPLLQTLSSYDASVQTMPETSFALLRNLIALDELEIAKDILEQPMVQISNKEKAGLVSDLMSRAETRSLGLELAEGPLASPESAASVVRELPRAKRVAFMRKYSGPLGPELSLQMLKAGNPANYALEDLGLSQGCWRYIWYMVCCRSTEIPDLRHLVAETFVSGHFRFSLAAVEAILQALIVIDGDLPAVIGVLFYMKEVYGYDVPTPLAGSIYRTLDKAMEQQVIQFSKPKDADVMLETFDGDQIDWETVTRNLMKLSKYEGGIDELIASSQEFVSTLPFELDTPASLGRD